MRRRRLSSLYYARVCYVSLCNASHFSAYYIEWCFHREVNSGFFYKSANEREKLVKAERKFIEERVQKIIALKNKVCADNDKGFVVINQKVSENLSYVSQEHFSLQFSWM